MEWLAGGESLYVSIENTYYIAISTDNVDDRLTFLVSFEKVFHRINAILQITWMKTCGLRACLGLVRQMVNTIEYVQGFFVLSYAVIISWLCGWFNHILPGCFTGTGKIIKLLQCHWSNPELARPQQNTTQQNTKHVPYYWDMLYCNECCCYILS